MAKERPGYIRLFNDGELFERIDRLMAIAGDCTLCPHQCHVDRNITDEGQCRSGILPYVSSSGPHFGEETPLVGYRGSGTIFMTNCNLHCIFCQNYDISQQGKGKEISYSNLARMMVELQLTGCHNINFVSPTHMVHAIVKALPEAIEMGLRIPLVYNSGGYDDADTIRLLRGIFDIYMPDLKYFDNDLGWKYSGIKDYVEMATSSISEMYRQIGELQTDDQGVAQRGLLIRHLMLPGHPEDTFRVIDFVKSLSENIYFNLMDQYHPAYNACKTPPLDQYISRREFEKARSYAIDTGLLRMAD